MSRSLPSTTTTAYEEDAALRKDDSLCTETPPRKRSKRRYSSGFCPASLSNSPAKCINSPYEFGDRFVPSRSLSHRLGYSLFEGEVVAADVARETHRRLDRDPTYSLLLRATLFGTNDFPIPLDREQQLKQLRTPLSPGKSLFRFRNGDALSPHGGPPPPTTSAATVLAAVKSPVRRSPSASPLSPVEGPYKISDEGGLTSIYKEMSPSRVFRRLCKAQPYKVLDAPGLQNNFYYNVLDWSQQDVIAIGLGRSAHLFSVKSGKVTHLVDLSPDLGGLTSLCWSPGGTYLSVGCGNGLVQVWDISRKQLLRSFSGHVGRVGCISWGGVVLSTGSQDRSIAHRDLRSPEDFVGRYVGHYAEVCGLKWSPDDRYLASGCNGNRLMTWTLRTAQPEHIFAGHTAAVRALDWSPRQPTLLASGGGTSDRHIRIWNVENGAAVRAVDTGSQVCQLRWSQTTSEIVSAHGFSRNEICVWSYPGLTKLASYYGHQNRVLYLTLSADGQTVVTGAGDETIQFWALFPPAEDVAPSNIRISSPGESAFSLRSTPTLR